MRGLLYGARPCQGSTEPRHYARPAAADQPDDKNGPVTAPVLRRSHRETALDNYAANLRCQLPPLPRLTSRFLLPRACVQLSTPPRLRKRLRVNLRQLTWLSLSRSSAARSFAQDRLGNSPSLLLHKSPVTRQAGLGSTTLRQRRLPVPLDGQESPDVFCVARQPRKPRGFCVARQPGKPRRVLCRPTAKTASRAPACVSVSLSPDSQT